MKNYIRKSVILLLIIMLGNVYYCSSNLTEDQKLTKFFNKESVRILVTDSGLGGVSVAADVVERMKDSGIFKQVNVIYFNAQPHIKSGYNKLKTTEQKVQIFENALNAMVDNFDPDLILIGCNTLSVLYPLTEFSQKANFPVIGIVETGVDLIKEKIDQTIAAKVLIFATRTTVKQGTHKRMLVEGGIKEEKIITQACPKLAGSIERGSHSEETYGLVEKYVKSIIEKIEVDNDLIFVSFNCTNYGYIRDVFAEFFEAYDFNVQEYLDPNSLMANFIFESEYRNRFPTTEVNINFFSQPELPPERIVSISGLIKKLSPQTVRALERYEFKPDYFEWKSIAEKYKKNAD